MRGIYSKDFAPKRPYFISRQLRRKIWLIFGRRLESETYFSVMCLFRQDGKIRHVLHDVCLDIEGDGLVVRKCDNRQTQKWRFSAYPEEDRSKSSHSDVL